MTTAMEPRIGAVEGVRPPGARELTPRAIICGLVVAAVMGASYPYIVLKLGFGPNVSVVAAFFGYLALGIVFRDYTRWENNMVQTAGTAGAQTAFMCVLLAAFDMLSASPNVSFTATLSPIQAFLWLTIAGLLGVLLAVPMRQHFVVDEKLTYADGVAAAETIIVLDSRGGEASRAARALGIGVLVSASLMLMTEDALVLKWFPSTMLFGTAVMMTTGVGVNWSLLSLGSGMIVGMRINASMLLGTIAGWMVAPYLLLRYGVIGETFTRTDVLFWVMWPATAMMVSGGLTALVLRWSILKRTFSRLSGARADAGTFPLRWVVVGVVVLAVALMVLQQAMFGVAMWLTGLAILLSLPLMLVGLRVLGETNWGPISQMTNMMQVIFGAIAPGNLTVNMVSSGTTGTIAVESEALMQDYKAGYMIGSSPKSMTIMQLLGTPVGAAAVAWMYPLLRQTYGIVGDNAGLSSPISRRLAGFAEILSQGFDALPAGAVPALFVGVALGILFTLLEERKIKWVPSPTGTAIGMLVPASVIIVMFLGSVVDVIWRRVNRSANEAYMVPLASGLIAGEAIVAVVIPLLVALKVINQ